MKLIVKIASAALLTSAALAAPAYAGSDNEDYNTAKALCRAEVTKATGASSMRDGGISMKSKVVELSLMIPVDGKRKSVGCVMNRNTQAVTIELPKGFQPAVAAAPAETAAVPAETAAAAAPVTQ
ncbi:MAG: hypothetical protein ABWZ40_00215 [Caulobacterales bacterium]